MVAGGHRLHPALDALGHSREWRPHGYDELLSFKWEFGEAFCSCCCFMGSALATGFDRIGKALKANKKAPADRQFLIWTLGSILFGHVTTFVSISYFDQTVVISVPGTGMYWLSANGRPPAPGPNPRRAPTWSKTRPRADVPDLFLRFLAFS